MILPNMRGFCNEWSIYADNVGRPQLLLTKIKISAYTPVNMIDHLTPTSGKKPAF